MDPLPPHLPPAVTVSSSSAFPCISLQSSSQYVHTTASGDNRMITFARDRRLGYLDTQQVGPETVQQQA